MSTLAPETCNYALKCDKSGGGRKTVTGIPTPNAGTLLSRYCLQAGVVAFVSLMVYAHGVLNGVASYAPPRYCARIGYRPYQFVSSPIYI